MTEHDPVNSPNHYVKDGLEAIDVIVAFLGPEGAYWYCRGNAIKYQLRADDKWNPPEDHEKTGWYVKKAAELWRQIHEENTKPEPPF